MYIYYKNYNNYGYRLKSDNIFYINYYSCMNDSKNN